MTERECFDPSYLDGTAAGTMDCPFCEVSVGYSDEDPDSAFSDLLSHIQRWHPEQDQAPAVLWPRIEITK